MSTVAGGDAGAADERGVPGADDGPVNWHAATAINPVRIAASGKRPTRRTVEMVGAGTRNPAADRTADALA